MVGGSATSRIQKSLTKKVRRLVWMYSESRSSGILMLVTSWFSRKKKARTGRYLLKTRHGNAYFIILGFTAEQ